MNVTAWLLAAATALATVAMWLMLPRPQPPITSGGSGRSLGFKQFWLGALCGAISLGLFAAHVPRLGDWLGQGTFWVLAGFTVISAATAMTLKNPVYCAVWFGASLLGTAGLLFLQGAQFLGVATMVVYAGAILVTLLFVLMLANPEGRDAYDRLSWEPPLSAAAGIVLVGILSMTVANGLKVRYAPEVAIPPRTASDDILNENHVARLGAELFSRHLVAIEVAGVLLFAALVGAVAIVVHSRGRVGPAGSPLPTERMGVTSTSSTGSIASASQQGRAP